MEIIQFCDSYAERGPGITSKKSVEFCKGTLLPMLKHAHAAFPHVGIVGMNPPATGFFQGQSFGRHVPKRFQLLLATRVVQQRGFQFLLGQRQYRIHVVSLKRRTEAFYQDCIYRIHLWLSLLSHFAPKRCSQHMNVYMYLLPDEKVLPPKGQGLGVEHVNTAFTTSCATQTEIHIFREEEWFKVLIHETFHNHGLDFSENFDMYHDAVQAQLKQCYPALRSPVLLFESYCEFWALLLHTLLEAFVSSSQKAKCWTQFQRMLRIEQTFSQFQCVKVLDHYGLTFTKDVLHFDGPKVFDERQSNAFAYYVIKSVMISHCDAFLEWHLAANGPTLQFAANATNIRSFCKWLYPASRDPLAQQRLQAIETVYAESPRMPYYMRRTLRLSAFS